MIRLLTLLLALAVSGSAVAQMSGGGVFIVPYREAVANNWGGAITTGGSWQQVMSTNPNRSRLFVQNYCTATSEGIGTSESMFFVVSATIPANPPTTSGSGAIELMPCGDYDSSETIISTQPVWIYANTTGHKFLALEW